MALLRGVRYRGRLKPGRVTGARVSRIGLVAAVSVGFGSGCSEPDPERIPDATLQHELGLTEDDQVYTVTITGGEVEVAEPATDSVPEGSYLQFVTTDWLIHEVAFDVEQLHAEARAFLERTDQLASPPLLSRDSRFVVSFEGAPPGRYPYVLAGNGGPGRGLIVVTASEVR